MGCIIAESIGAPEKLIKKINLKESIRAYGSYSVEIKLFQDVSAKFLVNVHE